MSLLLVPELIRMYLSLERIDFVFFSLCDIRGFIDIPGKTKSNECWRVVIVDLEVILYSCATL